MQLNVIFCSAFVRCEKREGTKTTERTKTSKRAKGQERAKAKERKGRWFETIKIEFLQESKFEIFFTHKSVILNAQQLKLEMNIYRRREAIVSHSMRMILKIVSVHRHQNVREPVVVLHPRYKIYHYIRTHLTAHNQIELIPFFSLLCSACKL